MNISLHRVAVAVAAVAVTGGLALAPSAAQADQTPQATSAAQWLASQVPSSTHLFESAYDGGTFVDYGLNLDLQYALDQLGESSTAAQVYAAAVAHAGDYTDAYGTRYAGSVGKLATYVELHGDDPTDLDGRNLIDDLEKLQVAEAGAEQGRLKDFPDSDYQSANTVGQSWGVRALAGARSDAADSAADFLADQQCDDGGFRLYQVGTDCTSSVDATTFAITALQASGGHGGAVSDAIDYLADEQAGDGSLSDAQAANSNSTSLAAVIFSQAGRSAAATKAAAWIVPLQATSSSTPGLDEEAGAIAYGPAEFASAKTRGIGEIERDQWVRTSVQAALALNLVSQPAPEPEAGPVASLALRVSDSTPAQGDTITVTATGKDADGTSTGDVSKDLRLSSSVDSDTISGNTVTFHHASPHTITVTHLPTGTTASVTVQVSPMATVDEPVAGPGGSGLDPAAGSDAALPDTGAFVEPWQLAGAVGLLLLGGGLLIGARRRTATGANDR